MGSDLYFDQKELGAGFGVPWRKKRGQRGTGPLG